MKRTLVTLCVAALLLAGLMPRGRADLASYLKKPEPAYKWELTGQKAVDGGTVYDLHLVSLVWQGITWEHHLQVFRPDKIEHPEYCAIYNTGGNGNNGDANTIGMGTGKRSGTVSAILWNIPNQPLYGGKTEDALVVYTWLKFMETGDETWPLHFPMAKAVLKAMDAIQEFTKQQKQTPITSFVVYGASKRGWTTWLVGASRDKRVKAIAPMVIDTLNLPAQGPHMLAYYGAPTAEIGDYSAANMGKLLATERGKRLIELEDPYSYRNILTLPKLIILGTNDPYWAQDALNFYWDGLKGPKWISYTPNSGHGLNNRPHVYATLTAFIHSIAAHRHWPKMNWKYGDSISGADLFVTSDIPIKSARLFRVHNSTLDFRMSHWTSEPMTASNGGFAGHLDTPAEGYTAIFGEETYEIDGQEFTLSTQIKLLSKNKLP